MRNELHESGAGYLKYFLANNEYFIKINTQLDKFS